MLGVFPLGRLLFGGWVYIGLKARPSSDVSTGGWTTAPLFSKLDETTRDDTDYAVSPNAPASDSFEIALASIADPATDEGHVVRYAIGKDITHGSGGLRMVVQLLQGSTVIAEWVHTPLPAPITTYTQMLTTAQANSITNYGDLRLRFTAETL